MTQNQESEIKEKSLLNKILTTFLPLILGIVIIYLIFKDVKLGEMWSILKDANWFILFFSLIFGWLGNTFKAHRWRLFIRPLGYEPKLRNLIFATWGNFAVNFAIPRAGEVWRCGIVAKEDKIPFTKLVGTMLVDRIFDTLAVLCITLFAFAFNMNFFITQLKHNQVLLDKVLGIIKSPYPYIVIVAALILIYIIFKYFRNNKIVAKLIDIIKSFLQDIKLIGKMDSKWWILIYTAFSWTCYFFYFYVTFFAFDFTKDLGITAGLIAFAMSSISMAIPSNGGLGPWQVAVIAALSLYGVDKLSATAFATGVFTMQSLWVILWGLIGIGALAVVGTKKK